MNMSGIHVYILYESTPYIGSTTKRKNSTMPASVKATQITQNKQMSTKTTKHVSANILWKTDKQERKTTIKQLGYRHS